MNLAPDKIVSLPCEKTEMILWGDQFSLTGRGKTLRNREGRGGQSSSPKFFLKCDAKEFMKVFLCSKLGDSTSQRRFMGAVTIAVDHEVNLNSSRNPKE